MHDTLLPDRLTRFLVDGPASLAVDFRGLDGVADLVRELRAERDPPRIDRQLWDGLDFRRIAPDRLAQLAFGIVRSVEVDPACPRRSVAVVQAASVAAEPLALLRGLGVAHLALDATAPDATDAALDAALERAALGDWESVVLVAPPLADAPEWSIPPCLERHGEILDGVVRRAPRGIEPADPLTFRRPFTGGTDPLEEALARLGLRRVHRALWWRRDRATVPLWADRWLLPDARRLGLGPGSLSRRGDAVARAPHGTEGWRRAARTGVRAWSTLRREDWLGVALLDALWREEPVPCHHFRTLGGAAWQGICEALAGRGVLPATLLDGVPALSREERLRLNAELIATDGTAGPARR